MEIKEIDNTILMVETESEEQRQKLWDLTFSRVIESVLASEGYEMGQGKMAGIIVSKDITHLSQERIMATITNAVRVHREHLLIITSSLVKILEDIRLRHKIITEELNKLSMLNISRRAELIEEANRLRNQELAYVDCIKIMAKA